MTGGRVNGVEKGGGSALAAILFAWASDPLTDRSNGRVSATPPNTDIFIRSRLDSSIVAPSCDSHAPRMRGRT
jgi:hypothetical protein